MFKNLYTIIIAAALTKMQPEVAAQTSVPVQPEPVEVCAGRRSEITVTGSNGSRFTYNMPREAGRRISLNNDTLVWEWAATPGKTFRIGVHEMNPDRCLDAWGFQDVTVVGSTLKFEHDEYVICDGDRGVKVRFNEDEFISAVWSDPSIKNNYITRPGVYELKAFDKVYQQCLTSKEITVLAGPKVNLGPDTMICSPDFRFYAMRTNANPEATVYRWSSGEETVNPYLDVHRESDNENYFLWVRAEWNGCTTADTVVVLACRTPERMKYPNTFTPNGDGENDVWNISDLQYYPKAIVEVYDRWGRRVFVSSPGYPKPWDGRDINGSDVPVETYYYIITLNDALNSHPLLGTITVIR